MKPLVFLVTCEHGGNRIPVAYRELFRGHARLLQTHEAYDPGALAMGRDLAASLGAPLIASTVSRLLVELNRSPSHPALFSRVVRDAPDDVLARIYERHYLPYRTEVEAFVADAVGRNGCVLHLSSHSFTPVLRGDVRDADIGLLYDPARPIEKRLCAHWRDTLAARLPGFRVRLNYPYRGYADGLTTYLRRNFGDDVYVGVELEMNQKHVCAARNVWHATRREVAASLVSAIAALASSRRRRARHAVRASARP